MDKFFRFGTTGYAVEATRDSAFKIPPKEVITHVVYEIQPAPDYPNVEIVFFHGFELGDYRDAYWKDWLSRDGSTCWLGSWLVEEFPDARILTVSYDSSLKTTPREGRGDLHVVAQNLVSTLIRFGGRVGQRNCPVVLVGHSIGGLVMKKLMVMVNSAISRGKSKSGEEEVALESFFGNVKGLFFYATPHKGSRLAESMKTPANNSQLLQTLQILGTEIGLLQEEFMDLCIKLKWRLFGLGELLVSKLGHHFSGTVVERASAEAGMGANFTMVWEDHFSICKPRKKGDTSFESLTYFINKVIMKQSPNNSLQGTVDSLPFTADIKYVPLRETITEVRQALENKASSQVVILYGASGDGKTSMAKYLALFYAGAFSSNPETKFGKEVYFLRCGPKGSGRILTLLVQLWEDMGFGNPMLNIKSCWDASSNTDEQTSQCERLRKDLKKKLKQKHVLIVLDNVWDTELIQELFIPTENIKYLVTTQRTSIWLDGGCQKIRICKPSFEEARQILMNHIGMSSGEIPQHLEPHVTEVIKGCDSSPLKMANVAITIKHDKVLKESEWRTIEKDLKHRVEGVPQSGAILFNRIYSSGTISNATSLAVNSFSKEAQTLLCIAAICDSPFDIPEIVFKMFYKVVHSKMSAFSLSCDDLVGSDFIKVENKDLDEDIQLYFDFPKTTWSIHEDRQYVIRDMENCKVKVESIVSAILESEVITNDKAVLQALLFLYGEERWRKQVAEKLGIDLNTNNLMHARDHMQPFIFLLDSNGEEESHIPVSKVILHYVRKSELDYEAMSKLCLVQEVAAGVCLSLSKLFFLLFHRPISTAQHKSKMRLYPGLVGALLELIDKNQNLSVQYSAVAALSNITIVASDNAKLVVASPGALECLRRCLALDPAIQQPAARVIGSICSSDLETRLKVGSFPGLVGALVAVLNNDIDQNAQEVLLVAIQNIVHDASENSKLMVAYPGSLECLIRCLALDGSPTIQQRAANVITNICSSDLETRKKVGSFPGLVGALVAVLNKDIDQNVQEAVLGAILNITSDASENSKLVVAYPGSLECLIRCLALDGSPTIQQWAATTVIRNICSSDLETRNKVGLFPGLVGALVAVLNKDMDQNVQEAVLGAILNITSDASENSKLVVAYPGSLECLIRCLALDGSPTIQQWAAFVISNICSSDLETRNKVGTFPGLVGALVAVLNKDMDQNVQEAVLGAILNITNDASENSKLVVAYPGSLECLIRCLALDGSPTMQQGAAIVIKYICSSDLETRDQVGSFPGLMGALAALLNKDIDQDVQEAVLVAIHNITIDASQNTKLVVAYPGSRSKWSKWSRSCSSCTGKPNKWCCM